METILKRVFYKSIFIPDLIITIALMHIVGKKLQFQVQDFPVLGENNVPSLVIGEPVLFKAPAESATLRLLFQDFILMAQEVS